MRWVEHAASSPMGEKRGAYLVLVGKTEGKRPLGRPKTANYATEDDNYNRKKKYGLLHCEKTRDNFRQQIPTAYLLHFVYGNHKIPN